MHVDIRTEKVTAKQNFKFCHKLIPKAAKIKRIATWKQQVGNESFKKCRHNVRDFLQTKLDSEINARFLLNEHGDPHFLFYKFNEYNILNNWEKNWQKSKATFLANEINATDRDVAGPTEQAQIMFPLNDKNIN